MSPLFIDEVLTPSQKAVWIQLSRFKQIGILAGGTALAFQLKHRRSFDFDIFTPKNIPENFSGKIKKNFGEDIEIFKESEIDLTFYTPTKVKITFFHYPFKPLYPIVRTPSAPIFSWKEIAADKAYTLGRRPIYRDYVDLFFIIKRGHKLKAIILDAQKKFSVLFSEKLFLEQLTYFGDLQEFGIEFLQKEYAPGEIKSFFEKVVENYTKDKIKYC